MTPASVPRTFRRFEVAESVAPLIDLAISSVKGRFGRRGPGRSRRLHALHLKFDIRLSRTNVADSCCLIVHG